MVRRIIFTSSVIFFGLLVCGTEACQENYFLNIGKIETPTPDPTETSTPTVTPTEDPDDNEDSTPTPTVTVTPTVGTTTSALIAKGVTKSDFASLSEDNKKNSVGVKTTTTTNKKIGNYLGRAFIKDDAGADDNDQDGISDVDEETLGTDPGLDDTDSDGCVDGVELMIGSNPGQPNVIAKDLDGDCLPDEFEAVHKLDPREKDTNHNGINDGIELLTQPKG